MAIFIVGVGLGGKGRVRGKWFIRIVGAKAMRGIFMGI